MREPCRNGVGSSPARGHIDGCLVEFSQRCNSTAGFRLKDHVLSAGGSSAVHLPAGKYFVRRKRQPQMTGRTTSRGGRACCSVVEMNRPLLIGTARLHVSRGFCDPFDHDRPAHQQGGSFGLPELRHRLIQGVMTHAGGPLLIPGRNTASQNQYGYKREPPPFHVANYTLFGGAQIRRERI